jgi:hypothetical protein
MVAGSPCCLRQPVLEDIEGERKKICLTGQASMPAAAHPALHLEGWPSLHLTLSVVANCRVGALVATLFPTHVSHTGRDC